MRKMEYLENRKYFPIDYEFHGHKSSQFDGKFDYIPTPNYAIPID